MNLIFSAPTSDDLIRFFRAWRFWVLGAVIGAFMGAAIYKVAPPPFRAQATVLVDFNLEQAWPQETDRQQFYYLERETRKLEEIAWSDEVMAGVSMPGESVEALRGGVLHLSQPADGGWHFYAEAPSAERAVELASAWAQGFLERAQAKVGFGELNPFIQFEVTQSANLPVKRSIPMSTYMLIGAFGLLAIGSFAILFFIKPK